MKTYNRFQPRNSQTRARLPVKTFHSLVFFTINPYDNESGVIAKCQLNNGKTITVWGGSPLQNSNGVDRFDFKIENPDETPLFIRGAKTLRNCSIDDITSTMVNIQTRYKR